MNILPYFPQEQSKFSDSSLLNGHRYEIADFLEAPSNLIMRTVYSSFAVEDESSLSEFMSSNLDVRRTMPRLRFEVSKVFGPGTSVLLAVQHDHSEEYDSLVARIQFNGTAEQALDRLDKIGENWWYSVSASFNGLFVLDVELA